MDGEVRTQSPLEHMLLDKNAEPIDLPISLLKAITNDFSDDLKLGEGGFATVYKGLLGNGGTVAVKKLSPSRVMDKDEDTYNNEVECLMRVKHKNVVRFLGYCADTQGKMFDYKGKFVMADKRQRLLCFEYLPNRSLDEYITDASGGLEWRKRYKIIKGICEGLDYLHEKNMVHLDLKPANVLLDDNMLPKITDFGVSRSFDEKQSRHLTKNVIGTTGYMAPEHWNGEITKKSDIYSLGVLIAEILTGQKKILPIEHVLDCWTSRFKSTSPDKNMLLEQVRVCAEISFKCGDFESAKRPVTSWIIERLYETADDFSQELLQIHPVGLRFPFEPNKEICCPVNLTNKTNNEVYYSIIPSNPKRYAGAEQLKGVVPPRSTHAVFVTMAMHQNPPPKIDQLRVIMGTSRSVGGGMDQEESLIAFICDPSHANQAMEKEAVSDVMMFGQVESMDVHPTKPWAVTGHSKGYVCIWKMNLKHKNTRLSTNQQNGDNEKLFVSSKDCARFMSVKFIPQTQCVVSGDSLGFIHVYTYIDNELVEVTTIEAHSGAITSVAVHPTRHCLLSSCGFAFKLWEWNEGDGWVCSLKWPLGGCQVAFNPSDSSKLAIVLDSHVSLFTKSIVIWTAAHPKINRPILSLPSESVSHSTCVAYCFSGSDSQYVAIGHEDGNTEILDNHSEKYVHALQVANSGCVVSVACHPTLPLLVTGTSDGTVYLWNCTTYRLVHALPFGHGNIIGFGFMDIDGLQRLLIGFSNIIKMVEINWATVTYQQ